MKIVSSFLPALGALLVGWKLFIFFSNGFHMIVSPYATEYGEPFMLLSARRLLEGIPIYLNKIGKSDQLATFYPPIYYLLYGLLEGKWGGGFLWGRILSLTAMAGSLVIVYDLALHFTGRRGLSLLASLIFLQSRPVHDFGWIAREDFLAFFFSFLGLWCVIRLRDNGGLWFSLPLFLLALFTRHSLLAAPLAVAVDQFFQNRKRGLLFSLIFFGLLFSVGLILNQISDGGFLKTLFGRQMQGDMPRWWSLVHYRYLAWLQGLMLPFLALLFWIFRRLLSGGKQLLVLYPLFATLVSLSMVKGGAGSNYLLEITMAVCLSIAFFGHRWLDSRFVASKRALLFLLSLLLLTPFYPSEAENLDRFIHLRQKIETMMKETREEVFLEVPDLIVLHRLPQPIYEIFMSRHAEKRFYEEIVGKVSRQKFEWMVLDSPAFSGAAYRREEKLPWGKVMSGYLERFTPALVTAIEENYSLVPELGLEGKLYFLRRKRDGRS